MLHTLRLGPRAWSGIVVGIFLAAFLGQSFMPASVGVAQWETSTPTVTLRYNAAVTSSQQLALEPLTTTFPFDTSTPTPTQLLPLEPLTTLSPFDTSTPTPSQQLSSESLIPLLPLATSTRTPTPINIGNFVWDDLDADGVQDAGEPGVAGVTVQLWNSARTSLIASTLTSGTGTYTLVAPIPGDYRIRVVLSAGNQFTAKDQGGDDTRDSDINSSGTFLGFTDIFNIASNVISTTIYDAGIIVFRTPTPTRTPTPINIGNFVWDDLDADGMQDAGEPGVAGVTVQLWNSTISSLIASTLTSVSGTYTLVAPIPGDYRIRVVLSAGNQFTAKDQGFDDTRDSDINSSGALSGFTDLISIAPNVISTTIYDAGIIVFRTPTPTRTPTPINIGNFIWRDSDADGIQDAGETGVPNVVVQLWNSAKTQLIYTTITNGTGNYSVVAPFSGDYRIRVLLPVTQALFSPKLQGLDAAKDSNINSSGVDFGFTDIISIAPNVISTTIYDGGMTNLPAVLPSPSFLPFILK